MTRYEIIVRQHFLINSASIDVSSTCRCCVHSVCPRNTKQAVDPLPFLRTVKDLDGNAIDVSVQQDAQGFLLDLFDKMEVRAAPNRIESNRIESNRVKSHRIASC